MIITNHFDEKDIYIEVEMYGLIVDIHKDKIYFDYDYFDYLGNEADFTGFIDMNLEKLETGLEKIQKGLKILKERC